VLALFGCCYAAFQIACALAALLKPALYVLLPKLNLGLSGNVLLQWSSLIDWLSFFFEYLFGVCIQLYLILLVYMWVRAISFTRAHLLDVAIRRFNSVVKWAAIVMLPEPVRNERPRADDVTGQTSDRPLNNHGASTGALPAGRFNDSGEAARFALSAGSVTVRFIGS
jgi:hypothetical protein